MGREPYGDGLSCKYKLGVSACSSYTNVEIAVRGIVRWAGTHRESAPRLDCVRTTAAEWAVFVHTRGCGGNVSFAP